jgi:hypothetical protein
MNGMIQRKSRYLTLSAVIRKAGPRLATIASATKAGQQRHPPGGRDAVPQHQPQEDREVDREIDERDEGRGRGTISRGKYTLPIRLALPTRLLEVSRFGTSRPSSASPGQFSGRS